MTPGHGHSRHVARALLILCVIMDQLDTFEFGGHQYRPNYTAITAVETIGRPLTDKCEITLAMAMCAKLNTQKNEDFGCPDSDEVLKVKYGFERQINQTIVLIKSVLSAQKRNDLEESCLEIILFTNTQDGFDIIKEEIKSWDSSYTKSLRLTRRVAIFPNEYKFLETNYAPCASLRLFIRQLLPDYDSVIYTDTDMIFFSNIQKLWDQFSLFPKETIAAMAADQYGFTETALIDNAKYPGRSGVNSGLILMNLTKIRQLDHTWIPTPETLQNSKNRIFDQELLNNYLQDHPEKLNLLPCYWNFQDIFCRSEVELFCKTGEAGIRVLQGSGHRFTASGSEPRFFEIFKEFQNINMSLPLTNFNFDTFHGNVKTRLENIQSNESWCDKRLDFNNIVLQGLSNMGNKSGLSK